MADLIQGARVRRARVTNHLALIGFALVCGLGSIVVMSTRNAALPVVLPMLATLGVAGVAVIALWDRRGGGPSLFEIGAVYVAVVSLYTLYPLLAFLANGLRYTPFGDGRLFNAQPRPAEIGIVAWYHVVHLSSFVVVYTLARGRRSGSGVRPLRVDRPTLLTVIFLYLTVKGFFVFLRFAFDLAYESYSESYLAIRRLPLLLHQMANHLGGVQFTLELLLLAALFANYRRCRLVIGGWVLVLAVSTFVELGNRTELMLLLMAVVLMYHHAVRPIRVGRAAVGAAGALALFVGLGRLRSGSVGSPDAADVNSIFGRTTEFDTVFGNAYDVRRLRESGEIGDLPMTFHLADFVNVIPQQVSPFVKLDPAMWYVQTFYPLLDEAGGGLVFGTIAQSVLGGEWLDLVLRGGLLGLLLGLIHRYWVRRPHSLWVFVFYIWATVLVYHSFRNTTFALFPLFVYRFLPVGLAVTVLSVIWTKAPRSSRPALLSRVGSV